MDVNAAHITNASSELVLTFDTPSRGAISLSPTMHTISAATVRENVFRELEGKTHVADTDEFLHHLLPLDSRVAGEIYGKLASGTESIYDPETGRWAEFPTSGTLEKSLYAPFVNAANAIRGACFHLEDPNLRPLIDGTCWLDSHAVTPESLDPDAPLIRPEGICVVGDEKKRNALWEKLAKARDKLAECRARPKNPDTDLEDRQKKQELTEAIKDLKRETRIGWLQVQVPVEVKRGGSQNDFYEAVWQLCTYMRQVLREQLDRRFVIGLALCSSKLSVWLCDRSGLLGTKTMFDIHKEPEKFIHVIASLTLLRPAQLGWDPTMRLYITPRKGGTWPTIHITDSYDPNLSLNDYPETAYGTQWVIKMPTKDGRSHIELVTIRALSIARAEVMCGRATLVWLVMTLEDFEKNKSQGKLYVLKQAWRPVSAGSEGSFYQLAGECDKIGDLYSFEDVSVDSKPDRTDDLIHDGIVQSQNNLEPDRSVEVGNKRGCERDRDDLECRMHIKIIDQKIMKLGDTKFAPPVPRMRTRTLFETYGWPIKFFKDLPELLQVVRDAIEGHRYLYYKGILHRDVSAGNLLICPVNDDVAITSGRLIDLDYAKRTDKFQDPPNLKAQPPPLKASADGFRALLKDDLGCELDDEALSTCMTLFRPRRKALDYVEDMLKIQPELGKLQTPLTCEDLDLHLPKSRWPDFSARRAQTVTERTGTRAFMSYEILHSQGKAYFPLDDDSGRPCMHDCIHDLESFYWIVIYLCLTRDGPGGSRREELSPTSPNFRHRVQLRTNVYCLFDCDDPQILCNNRYSLMKQPELLKTLILPQFHTYFEDLKDLVEAWWRILRTCYKSGRHYDVHNRFIAAIDDALIVVNGRPQDDRTTAEIDRRKREWDSLVGRDKPASDEPVAGPWDPSPARNVSSRTSIEPPRGDAPRGRTSRRPSSPTTPRSGQYAEQLVPGRPPEKATHTTWRFSRSNQP